MQDSIRKAENTSRKSNSPKLRALNEQSRLNCDSGLQVTTARASSELQKHKKIKKRKKHLDTAAQYEKEAAERMKELSKV